MRVASCANAQKPKSNPPVPLCLVRVFTPSINRSPPTSLALSLVVYQKEPIRNFLARDTPQLAPSALQLGALFVPRHQSGWQLWLLLSIFRVVAILGRTFVFRQMVLQKAPWNLSLQGPVPSKCSASRDLIQPAIWSSLCEGFQRLE